jgi:hypothetical protein
LRSSRLRSASAASAFNSSNSCKHQQTTAAGINTNTLTHWKALNGKGASQDGTFVLVLPSCSSCQQVQGNNSCAN